MNTQTNMIRSDTTKELFTAYAKFQGEMPIVSMDSVVDVKPKDSAPYSFRYATLTAIVEAAKPFLSKNGLAVTQLVEDGSITTILTHSSGEFIGSITPFGFAPSNPQKLGSLITYLRRYAYSSILGIVSDEDDDGNAATGNEAVRASTAKPAKSFEDAEKDLGGKTITVKEPDAPATDKQMNLLNLVLKGGHLAELFEEMYGKPLTPEYPITKGQASEMIERSKEWLKAKSSQFATLKAASPLTAVTNEDAALFAKEEIPF